MWFDGPKVDRQPSYYSRLTGSMAAGLRKRQNVDLSVLSLTFSSVCHIQLPETLNVRAQNP
jgi:hypothetical protein